MDTQTGKKLQEIPHVENTIMLTPMVIGLLKEINQKHLEKNFAGIRYTYDAGRDAFIGPRPSNSFVLDEATCTWEAPVAFPTVTEKDGLMYIIEWDDSNDRWVGTVGGGNPQRWNPETSEWIEI